MKKFLSIFLFIGASVLSSDDEDFAYSYVDLDIVQAEDTGYGATISLGLPSSLYLRGSIEEVDAEIETEVFQKSSSIVSLGIHVSIADILKNVTKNGFEFNFTRFMDFYAEVGADKWELESLAQLSEAGTDIYVRGGIRMGDSEGWETNLYLENRSLAEVEINKESGEADYTLSEEINNTLGVRFTNNFHENMSVNINLGNDDIIGSTASVGIRFRL